MSRRLLASLVLVVGFALMGGCYARKPLDRGYMVRPGARGECVRICRTWGLQMSAMVVIANSTGCVCSPGPGAAAASRAASLAAVYHAVRDRRRWQPK